ncbi:hypothetical protein LTR17_006119 [Elasticomyces elasticus]|nr:hypothetical protein LTR17_006119 [Elasticomyces elasticus]
MNAKLFDGVPEGGIRLLVAVDLGTSALKVAYLPVRPNQLGGSRDAAIQDLFLPRQTAAQISAKHVIDSLKLTLYSGPPFAQLQKSIQAKLDEIPLSRDAALTGYLHDITAAVASSAKAEAARLYAKDEGAIEIQWLLPLPESWNASTKIEMAAIARISGMGNVQILSEPLCCAALLRRLPDGFGGDDAVLVVDLGRSTGQFCALAGNSSVNEKQYIAATNQPQGALLTTVVGQAEAYPCGSASVDRMCMGYIRRKADDMYGPGGFNKMCARCGLSEDMGEKEVLKAVGSARRHFDGKTGDFVHIEGDRGEAIHLELPSALIAEFFAPALALISASIKNQFQRVPAIKGILVLGEFGNSPYVKAQIASHYATKCVTFGWQDTVEAISPNS